MRIVTIRTLWILFFLFIIFNCNETDKKSHLQTTKRNYLLGTVPMPQNLDFSEEGMNNSFDLANEIVEVISISEKVSWADDGNGYSDDVNRANSRGLNLLISVDVLTDNREAIDLSSIPGAWTGTEDFSSSTLQTAFINEVKKIALDYNPEYLMLGIEVNIYKTENPSDFANYVSLYKSAYDEIKAISSDIKVGVIMQYEHIFDNNQWSLFDDFKDKIDVLCFTSYPGSLSAVSDDTYYTSVINYFQANVAEISNKKVIFTEIGIGGQLPADEVDQAEFVNKFFSITKGIDKELVIWCLLHDWPGGDYFEYMGLIDSSGRKKSAFYNWKDYSDRIYVEN